jgi:hypothetical protein
LQGDWFIPLGQSSVLGPKVEPVSPHSEAIFRVPDHVRHKEEASVETWSHLVFVAITE